MLLQKVRVDAQAREWVASQLAATAHEASSAPRPTDAARFAREEVGDAGGGSGGRGASGARTGAAGDDRALGS
ncbi:MAG: hypothetical protein ACLQBX_13550 [Candidatus Limnocylindrales bacterium]